METSNADLLTLLREQFEHEAFRPGQERIIRGLLEGRDVLALLPTGAGKSLVYQLAAQLLPGMTIVVSPLIALMKDQVESIEEHGLEVSVVDSTQSEGRAANELEEATEGRSKLLYVTPERFDNEAFMEELRDVEVSLFVVDEAHCVSDWGHAFRPSYLSLAPAMARLGRPPCLALTATATPWIRREIVERLGLRDPDIVVRGSDRPNLFLEVRRVEAEHDDRRHLDMLFNGAAGDYPPEIAAELQAAMQGSGIIYTATTKGARETAGWLQEWGISADYYHGQRKKADRDRVQEAFMSGDIRVITATNAFGLGIDKPDVRFVIHRDIPASIESYYQEAGRAGRDGNFARCTLIYRPADLGRAAFLSGGGELSREEVRQAREGLLAHPDATLRELEQATGLGRADLARLVKLLEQDGVVAVRRGRVRLRVEDFDPEQVSLDAEAHRRAYERSRLEMMRGYAELAECRRAYILNYFGEEYEPDACNHCDNDISLQTERRVVVIEEEQVDSLFTTGQRVVHDSWGEGTVQRIAADTLTILFDTVGYKTLATELIQERELVRPVTPE